MKRLRPRALLFVLAALAAADAAAINKCVDKAGKVTYQDGKCPDDARANELNIQAAPPTPAAVPGAPPPPPPNDPQFAAVESTITNYEACAAQNPEFAQRHIGEYESWKKTNQRAYMRVRRNEGAGDRIKGEVDKARAAQKGFTPEEAKARVDFCEASVPAQLGRNIEEFYPTPK